CYRTMTVPSNENVTERRGGQGGPARERDRLDPLAVRRWLGCGQLLSVIRPLSRSEPEPHPTGRPSLHKSLPASAEGSSAHRESATAPVALDSRRQSPANADRVFGLDPICAALCRLLRFFPSDASPAGTGCSRATSAHRGRCLLPLAQRYPVATRRSTAAPGCRFSAPHDGYHSSDTAGCVRGGPRSLPSCTRSLSKWPGSSMSQGMRPIGTPLVT